MLPSRSLILSREHVEISLFQAILVQKCGLPLTLQSRTSCRVMSRHVTSRSLSFCVCDYKSFNLKVTVIVLLTKLIHTAKNSDWHVTKKKKKKKLR